MRYGLVVLLGISIAVPAFGYNLRTAPDGGVLIWPQQEIGIVIDTSGVSDLPGVADAVRSGFLVWTSSGVPHSMVFTEGTAASSGQQQPNVVRWVHSDWPYESDVVAITASSYQSSTKFVTHSDVLFNSVHFSWTTQPNQHPGRYDVQNVMAHEAGHFYGMGHSEDSGATMAPNTPPAEIGKQSLSNDDLAGLVALVEQINSRTDGDNPIPNPNYLSDESNSPASGGDSLFGCDASEQAIPLWPALVLLLPLIAARRRMGLATSTFATVLLLAAAPADATVVRGYELGEMADSADTVVQGTVEDSRAVEVRGLIFTDHVLRVERCLRGSCQTRTVTVRTAGGKLSNGRGMFVDGAPTLGIGQRVFVFGRLRSHSIRSVGLAQGTFRVKGTKALRDLGDLHMVRRVGAELKAMTGAPQQVSLRSLERLVLPPAALQQLPQRDSNQPLQRAE